MPPPLPIQEAIPLYLADTISLESAIQSATQTSPTTLLHTTLAESKSLPRPTDTDPTTPTPDLPSPAQGRLLDFIRLFVQGRTPGNGRAVETGILLDDLINGDGDEDEDENGNSIEEEKENEAEEEYSTIHRLIDSAVREISISTRSTRVRDEIEQRDTEGNAAGHVRNSLSSGSGSGSGPGLDPWRTERGGRRRSSGFQKHLYNLVSFVAFLTKEKLLLHPGVGERAAAEMISETLDHPPRSPSHSQSKSYDFAVLHSHSHSSHGQGQEWREGQRQRHEPWFGFGSGSSASNEVSITAVSLWLIIMGEELYQRAREEERKRKKSNGKGKGKGGIGSGDVWTQLSEMVIWEWETWTTRLQFLSLREDLGIDAREQAAEAAAVMRRVY